MKAIDRVRRRLVMTSIGSSMATAAFARERPFRGAKALAGIESRIGGRLGVFAIDTGTGRQIAFRADERFAMCSTFKWVLAAAILARADRRLLSLEERISYGSDDLLAYAPIARRNVAEGSLTTRALIEAAVTVSDNTAANLLLAKLGGPGAFTRFVRTTGDAVTRLDRTEPALNTNDPGDVRDTTSPRAMAGLMRSILCGDILSNGSSSLLLAWLRASTTGGARLRAGLPKTWTVGDKTGTGERRAVNDVAIAYPPGRNPILIATYLTDGNADLSTLEAAHAEVGRLVAQDFARI